MKNKDQSTKSTEKKVNKRKDYSTQNAKIWSINFTNIRFVKRAQVLLPALKDRIGLKSMGLTVLMSIEYCQQERVYSDFLAFVNTRRRGLLNK